MISVIDQNTDIYQIKVCMVGHSGNCKESFRLSLRALMKVFVHIFVALFIQTTHSQYKVKGGSPSSLQ